MDDSSSTTGRMVNENKRKTTSRGPRHTIAHTVGPFFYVVRCCGGRVEGGKLSVFVASRGSRVAYF